MTASKRIAQFTQTKGRLPAWLWRDLHTARDNAGSAAAVLVIQDGPQEVVVLSVDDYNRIIDRTKEKVSQ